MSTVAYIPKSIEASVREERILALYACADAPTKTMMQAQDSTASCTDPPDSKTNHWVLSCATSSSSSVCIDPSPGWPNMSIAILVTEEPYQYNLSASKALRIVTDGLTVGALLQLIADSKYDKYQFTETAQGCRYWIHSVIHLLNRHGRLPIKAEVEPVLEALCKVWGVDGKEVASAEQTGMEHGWFYEL